MRFEDTFNGIGAGPVVAGAAALGILLGLAGGTSIDTTPLQRGETLAQLIADRQPASFDPARHTPTPYRPDHYPQLTRNGRIEVPELRAYILRHERPAEFVYTEEAEPAEAGMSEALPSDFRHVETGNSSPSPEPHLSGQTIPGTLRPAVVQHGGEAMLEPATAHIARADAISAELNRGAKAWEISAH